MSAPPSTRRENMGQSKLSGAVPASNVDGGSGKREPGDVDIVDRDRLCSGSFKRFLKVVSARLRQDQDQRPCDCSTTPPLGVASHPPERSAAISRVKPAPANRYGPFLYNLSIQGRAANTRG